MLDTGNETLETFKERWWSRYAQPNLAPRTLEMYSGILEKQIIPRLGKRKLCELTPELIEDFVFALRADRVGEASISKSLVILSGMLNRAVAWGKLATNPVIVVQRPRAGRSRTVRPLSPAQVEALRARLNLRDATLVSVLAYAGLRPGEALALTWGHIRARTILVEQAVSLGEIKSTKTGRSRTVNLLDPLATDSSPSGASPPANPTTRHSSSRGETGTHGSIKIGATGRNDASGPPRRTPNSTAYDPTISGTHSARYSLAKAAPSSMSHDKPDTRRR